ncbi:MAG TPA: thioredoxin-like domain-containing protein, partial [Emticicia sp.]
MYKKLLGTALVIAGLFFNKANAQGYEIKISIKNSKDSICVLTKYTWEQPYKVDTAKVDKAGNMVFKGKEPLEKGIYSLYSPKKGALYFDFTISDAQKLTITTDTINFYDKMKIVGSKENSDFLEFVKFMGAKNMERANFDKEIKAKKTADSTKLMTAKTTELFKDIRKYQQDYLAKNPGTYLATIIRLQTEIDVPNAPAGMAAADTAIWKYQYYKNHYWDGINLNDIGVLNTNKIFADKVKRFFEKVLIQNPDTLAKESDIFIAKIGNNKETFKWVVHNLCYMAESSKVMGMDAFFVYLVDKYYKTGQATWLDDKQLDKVIKRADILRHLLIGKKAQDLQLIDTSGIKAIQKMGIDTINDSKRLTDAYYKNQDAIQKLLVPMYNIKADYTVLVFWDVDCGHCKKEIPIIQEAYHKMKKEGVSVEVMAVYTQHEYAKWKTFIKDSKLDWINVADAVHLNNLKEKYDIFSTPVIYVLDKNKVIQA